MDITNYANEKFDIVVLAGQSNAEGNGRGEAKDPYVEKENVLQFIDKNYRQVYISDDYVLHTVYPFEYEIEIAKDDCREGEIIGNFVYKFADEYVSSGKLKKDRKLLIVKAAVGGAGFSKFQWGLGTKLEERLFDMTKKSLELNPENKIVALLWHQGEHDAFENAELSYGARTRFYYDKFNSFIHRFFDKFGRDIPVIAGGFCDEWKKGYLLQCKAVENAIKRSFRKYKSYFVSAEGLKSNNQEIGNGDIIHFSKKSLEILGKKYFDGFNKITK